MLLRWWQRYSSWWTKTSWAEQWQVLGVGVATILGATYRLYNLPYTLQFLADQGRDALIAWGILHFDVALVGPSTSVGSMYLGPLYYYFMSPFIWMSGGSPLGPAYAVAFLGIITIPLLYWVGKRLVGSWAAFFATLLYACGPYVSEYTRFSWNPNPAPIVTLAIIYGVWRAWKGSSLWWVWNAFWFAVIIQLHYVALLIAAPMGLFWLADGYRRRHDARKWAQHSLLSALVVLASFAPLFIFNWRFDNLIAKGFAEFFSREKALTVVSPGQQFWHIFKEQHGRALQVFFEILGREWFGGYRALNTFLLVLLTITLGLAAMIYRRTAQWSGYVFLILACVTTVFGLSFYKSSVFFHYITYFYPVAYLAIGVVIYTLARIDGWFGKIISAVILSYIGWLALQPAQLQFLQPLGWTMYDMEHTANTILQELPTEGTYGLALLSEIRDYRGLNYRYFLETSSRPPEDFAVAANATYLVVIAESPREAGDVLESPVYEISSFPKGEYRTVEVPNGPRLYIIERKKDEESMVK